MLRSLLWAFPLDVLAALWGIPDPCNREAFGAEIHPALEVNNI